MFSWPSLLLLASPAAALPQDTIVSARVAEPVPASVVIVVRAERLPPDRSMPAQISLDQAALGSNIGLRLDEALRVAPGAGLFRRTSSGAANATIQGLSLRPIAPNGAGRALVSLDGVPQNDPFGSWVFWVRHDPLFLDRVDVRRGAAGAGFGPLALTGTLDLVEARGGPTRIRLSAGGQGALQAAVRGSVVAGSGTITALASYEANDGIVPVSPRQRGAVDLPTDFTASTLTLVSEIPAANGQWSFRVSGFEEEKGAGTLGGRSAARGADLSGARKWDGDWGQSRLILFAETRDFSNQTVSVSTDRASVTPALDQFETPASALGGSLIYAPALARWSPRWTLDWRHSEGETRELFRFIGTGFTRTRVAGGAQDLMGLGLDVPRVLLSNDEQIGLDATVRLDRWAHDRAKRLEMDRATGVVTLSETPVDREGYVTTGRMSLFAFGGQARVSLFRTFRPPSLNELHRPFRVGNDVTEANANLVPEVLEGVDLDLKANWQSFGGDWSGSLTLYANKLRDPITNVTIGVGPGVLPRVGFLPAGGTLRQRLNAGEVQAKGLEAGLTWVAAGAGQRPEVEMRLSLVDAEVDGGQVLPALNGLRPAQSAPWASYMGLTLPFQSGLQLKVALRGEGPRFEDDLNTRKLKAYQALDLRASWPVRPDLDVFVSGENVIGSRIVTAISGAGILTETSSPLWRIGLTVTR
ncbi:MAG: hypothetical protein RL145_1377 [Pseudomonadota bacterium]